MINWFCLLAHGMVWYAVAQSVTYGLEFSVFILPVTSRLTTETVIDCEYPGHWAPTKAILSDKFAAVM